MPDTTDPKKEALEAQARRFDAIEAELKVAAEHARITALHFRGGEVARAGAHAFAMTGHLTQASREFDEAAVTHASKARTDT